MALRQSGAESELKQETRFDLYVELLTSCRLREYNDRYLLEADNIDTG